MRRAAAGVMMPIFGDYETTQEIYRHGLGALFRARHFSSATFSSSRRQVTGSSFAQGRVGPVKPSDGFAVKVHQAAPYIAPPQVLRAAAESFLQAAQVQQSVVDAGGRHWAPIYDANFGPSNDAAYYVTACYPRSAQKLIASRVKLSSSALYHIVDSVLKALIELKQTAHRAHGQLKPSNVLISGDGEIEKSKVVLTDPAPDDALQSNVYDAGAAEMADLAALGALIYGLVLHHSFHGAQSWPAPASPEWYRLGPRGNRWRELCNRLTHPERTESITLESVSQQIQALRARPSALTPRRLIAGSALLVGGALLAGALVYPGYARQWREFCLADDQWLDQFRRDLAADPQRLTRIEQEPALGRAVEEIQATGDGLDPKRVSGNQTMMISELAAHPPLTIGAFRKTPPALEVIHHVEFALSSDHWPLLHQVKQYQQIYDHRSWRGASAYLNRFANAVALDRQLASGIDKLLRAQPRLEDDLVFIEDSWQPVSDTENLIQKTAPNDKVLKQFSDFTQRYASSKEAPPGQQCTDLTNLRQGLVPLKDLARQLYEVLASDWPTRIDQQRLASEAQVYKLNRAPEAADFQQWLREAQDYYFYLPENIAGRIAALGTAADTAAARIKAVPEKIPDYSRKVGGLQDRLAGLRAQIEQLSRRRWVQKDRRNGAVAAEVAFLTSRVQGIGQDADRVTAENTPDQKKWWDTFVLTPPTADPSVINETWAAWRNELSVTRDQLPLDVSEFNKLRDLAQQWKSALIDVEKLFPPPPAVEAPYDSIAREKRRVNIQAAVNAANRSNSHPDLERMKKEASLRAADYAMWSQDLPRFIEDIHEARAQLDLGYGLDDTQTGSLCTLTDWKDHSVWKDLSIEGEAARVEQRFLALESLARASRAELADVSARKGGAPELVLAAWRRLGKLQNPVWPATVEEMRQEKSIYLNLVAIVGQFKDRIRGDQLGKTLQEDEIRRVAAFLNLPRDPSQVESAFVATIGSWHGSPDFDSLPLQPVARYNALLYGLRSGMARLAQSDRSAILKTCEAFRQGVGNLPADLQSEPDVAALLRQLDALKAPEPPHGPPAPWKPGTVSDGVVTFTGSLSGSAPTVLRFVRVDVPNANPVYLSTTEFSFADFLAIVPASSLTRANRGQLLLDYRDNADPRLGPRVWEWPSADSPANATLVQPDYWLRPHDDDFWDYSADFRDKRSAFNRFSLDAAAGGNPLHRPRLPMNYLPAPTALYVAGLVGCRLPTSAEWIAANAGAAKRGHYRGSAWRAQQQFIATQKGQPQWPDEGIFWPKGYAPKRVGAAAESYNVSDSTLFFHEVDADAASPESGFHNLTGNIAEFVWEDPAKFEQLADHSLPSIKAMLEQGRDQLFVIGGSALSAPELPLDAKLAVDLRKGSSPPSAWDGYADVGARLAFSATTPPARLLAKILESHSYLRS